MLKPLLPFSDRRLGRPRAHVRARTCVSANIGTIRLVGALALALVPAAAHAGARQQATVILSENPQMLQIQQEWGFADAVVTGDTVYLSGVVAGVRSGETDLKLAYERAFAAMGKTLQRAGAGWDDVVDMTSYHTDLTTQMPAIVAVKNKYVRSPPPAWTAIQVARLIPDNGITEIKLVAKVPRRAR